MSRLNQEWETVSRTVITNVEHLPTVHLPKHEIPPKIQKSLDAAPNEENSLTEKDRMYANLKQVQPVDKLDLTHAGTRLKACGPHRANDTMQPKVTTTLKTNWAPVPAKTELHKFVLIDGTIWPDQVKLLAFGRHSGGGGRRPHQITYGLRSPLRYSSYVGPGGWSAATKGKKKKSKKKRVLSRVQQILWRGTIIV
jgi:hypothetical protein